jgi:hypothetical protein
MPLVEFRNPEGKPVVVQTDAVDSVKPSSIEPNELTEVWTKGKRYYIQGAYVDVLQRLRSGS